MTPSIPADQVSYADLYARWEQGNWRATEIDLTPDRHQWEHEFTEVERRGAVWTYSLFFHGEDSVADNLSPFIDAAPREEQKYFLATQQVDEARHAVLFARFMREVASAGPDIGSALNATRPRLTWGFRKVFDRLDRMADELRRDHSRPKLAQAITLYHLVIEASLAQPGQHFIEEGLTRRDLLPGFREGIGNVARDEQRHIAFGVKMIADLVREDPDCEPAIADLLREVLPFTIAVFVPPGWDERYVTSFGFTLEDIYTEGAEAMEARLRAAGLDPLTMRLGLPVRHAGGRARSARADASPCRLSRRAQRRRQARSRGHRDAVRRPAPADRRLGRARRDDPVGLQRRRALAPAHRRRRCADGGGARARRRSRPHIPLPVWRLGRHRGRAHGALACPVAWEGAPDRQAADADPHAEAVRLIAQTVSASGAELPAV
jgi:hypothetical protein